MLAPSDEGSWDWRAQFIATYLECDLPQLGPRIPAEQMRRLWSVLAYGQGDLLDAGRLAASLGLWGSTVRRYLDVLTDLHMVRQLAPWSGNSRKRLVKSPKIDVRDAGLAHRLAKIPDIETLLGHPPCGHSWEGFAIEQLLAHLPDSWATAFYRTSAQAEVDLVLEGPRGRVLAIEIKRTAAPRPGKGFLLGSADVGAKATPRSGAPVRSCTTLQLATFAARHRSRPARAARRRRALARGVPELHRVGDAVALRPVDRVICDGHLAGRKV